MSTISVNQYNAKALINQGQMRVNQSTAPSGIRLNRRGRLARTFVVLSFAVVLASLFGLKAGAGTTDAVGAPTSFIEVTVAPGDTLWSLAARMADGSDVRAMVDEISTVNSLESAELQAGQKVRIPLR